MRWLLPALLLGGCATSAVPERPAPVLPAGFAVPQSVYPVEMVTLVDRLAADAALQQLLQAAMAANPDIETAAARVQQARAGLDAARAAGRPAIDASAAVTRARSSLDQFDFDAPAGRSQTLFQPTLSAGWEIDLFGRLAAGRAAAGARLDAADADARGVWLSVRTDVARNAVAVAVLDERMRAARTSLDEAQTLDRIARIRFEAGLETGLDPATTAADVADAAAALKPLESERRARLAALSQLTAMPVTEIDRLLSGGRPGLPTGWALPQVPSELLQRRPDIVASLSRLQAADAGFAEALASRYPRLTLTGSLGWLSTAAAGLLTGDAFAASVGGLLSGPLFDFGRTAAEVERNRGLVAEAAAGYRGTVLRALAETETAIAEADAARGQALSLQQSVLALTRARALSDVQYRGGLTDARTVSEAGRRLANARDRQLQTEGALIDAALRLELATGGGLEPARMSSGLEAAQMSSGLTQSSGGLETVQLR